MTSRLPPVDPDELGVSIVRDGYAIASVLPSDVVDDLRARFFELDLPRTRDVYRSFTDEPRTHARAIDQELKTVLASFVRAVLPRHKIIVATFVSKGPDGPRIDYHQDWTFTDERIHRSVLLWIPLVDVDSESGVLGVVPRSHRWTDGIRTSSDVRLGPTDPHQEALLAVTEFRSLDAGTAVIYDPATIHGSEPNTAPSPRPALIVITVPTDAPILHFSEFLDRVDGYIVDEAFFTTSTFESRPAGRSTYPPWADPVYADDFLAPLEALGQLTAGPFGRRSLPLGQGPDETADPASRKPGQADPHQFERPLEPTSTPRRWLRAVRQLVSRRPPEPRAEPDR